MRHCSLLRAILRGALGELDLPHRELCERCQRRAGPFARSTPCQRQFSAIHSAGTASIVLRGNAKDVVKEEGWDLGVATVALRARTPKRASNLTATVGEGE